VVAEGLQPLETLRAGGALGFVSRRVTADMKRFKEFIEKRGGMQTGAWRGQVDRPQP